MANYIGAYTSDFKQVFGLARIPVYALVSGSRTGTTEEEDLNYLPVIFLANNVVTTSRQKYCDMPYTALRRAICTISDTFQIVITCPFVGGTVQFTEFFKELDNDSQFAFVELKGERITFAKSYILNNIL